MRKLIPAALLGAAHLFIHFTIPLLDLALHAAFFGSLYWGIRNA